MPLRDRSLSTLSGGEKQKIAIASMLALEPDVLILDEPTSNLDPEATQHIFETLHALRNQKDLTVLIIEHKLNQLRSFDPKLILIEEGRITNQTRLNDYRHTSNRQKKTQSSSIKMPDQHATNPVLKIEDLHVNLSGKQILRNVSFSIYPGEFVALMGPNGSGKSTLLQTLMGFNKTTSGKINRFGKTRPDLRTTELVPDIGFIFQNPDHQLFTQSVRDEAALTLKNLDLMSPAYHEKTRSSLYEMGLEHRIEDHPQRLSYGEKRRLNLVAAILHHPRLLLIDEMLIGQDRLNADNAMQKLRSLTAEGCAILLVNHHADLTNTYCDRVLFMDSGTIIIDNSTSDAFAEIAEHGFSCYLPEGQVSFANV